ncbi:MAG TPA: DMT family transporter [Steroidobacteraceae bacterium]|jgi:drug/metabolite transporter (DMT)-like permease|nr:DMT family transporter [Steroidobacteraceae bacterium]
MNPHRRALVELHVCVVLWGFTAILGKLITLPALALVWWRMLLVSLALACFPRVWRALKDIPLRLVAIYAGIGGVVAVHWLTFYGSVKLANASVAATCMALAPAVTALIEPLVTGSRFERHNLVLGILVIPGVALVVGGIPGSMHPGFWVGVASAVLAALFIALNKRFLGHHDAMAVTWIELGAGFLLIAALSPFAAPHGASVVLPSVQDGAWLVVLAIFCTLIPFAVSLATLRHLSAFTAQLAINLEPVYTIFIAVLFLGEARELDRLFFLGVAIVLAAVFGHGWLQTRLTDERPPV